MVPSTEKPLAQSYRAETLIVDAAPLLQSPASLRGLARAYVTVQAVVEEVRDKTSRDLLASADWLGLTGGEQQQSGLQVRSPTAEALSKVTAFARQTGDLAVLSATDLAILALALTIEVEVNGWRRVREAPGKQSQEDIENPPKPAISPPSKRKGNKRAKTTQPDLLPAEPTNEQVDAVASKEGGPLPPIDQLNLGSTVPVEAEEEEEEEEEEEDDDSLSPNEEEDESEEDGGEWITPSNVAAHKSRDLGLIDSLDSPSLHANANPLTSACITGDFAMQNVLIQMGLDVIGAGGKKVSEIRTWVLRCHGCFKICKDPTKRFCPHCGGPTLTRVSITYVTPTRENPKGYIVHLKRNFQYRLRGTVYSLPSPLKANAKGAARDELILREDQKEWQRGVKKADVARMKEERAATRAARDPATRGGPRDPDWVPAMLVGEKGRRQPGEGRIGKDGLPIIGYGRRNPNEVRRKAK